MWTKLYWMEVPWPGKIAIAARPRGGEWLEYEIASWRRAGLDIVLSLLTPEEESELEVREEAALAEAQGLKFFSFPIADRQTPYSEVGLAKTLEQLESELKDGRNALVHCRQGVGRAGLVAACLLLQAGLDPETAVRRVSAARGVEVPETAEQRKWIDRYAGTAAGARHE